MSKAKKTLSDLIPDSKNFNKGTAQGDILLTKSIEEFGFREAATLDVNGVLIGGNKRTAKAGQLGFEEVEIIKADSTKVYALQYDDIDITTEKGRRLALALNQTASKNILIDAEMVEAELSEAVMTEWGVPNYSKGVDENNMNEDDLNLDDEFDSIGSMDGKQRVVFLFDGPEDAESYLNSLKVNFKKQNMAWQVNLTTTLST
jgi:hypothetical protein